MADDESQDKKRIFGLSREQVVFVGGPLAANVVLIAYYLGECWAFRIPFFLVSVTPADVLVAVAVGLLLPALTSSFQLLYFWVARLSPGIRMLLAGATLVLAFLAGQGKAILVTVWSNNLPTVLPSSTCIIVAKFGDNFIASDYPVVNNRLTRTFTVYPADHLPAITIRKPETYKASADLSTSCPSPEGNPRKQ